MKQVTMPQAAPKCHWKCRTSTKTGPFAMCQCSCRGQSHGTDTLAALTPFALAREESRMKQEVLEGEALMKIRVYLAQMKDSWKARQANRRN